LTLSAKSEQSLHAYVQRYLDLLATYPDVDLGDLCYTSHIGRSHFSHRLGLAASSVTELRQQLAAFAVDPDRAGICYGLVPTNRLTTRIAFLFTGQGSQYVGMGRELYASHPTFRATLDRCEELYREATGKSLLAVLYPPTDAPEQPALEETTYTQPALFALEYALATLWQSWGVQPDYLLGHSVGEVAAACVAGVFSLEDGMKLIAARGRLMGALPGDGAMIAVTATEAAVRQAIATYKATTERVDVAVAAVNGPTQVVLSGQREAVYAVAALLTGQTGAESTFAQGAASIKALQVSHAFHSPLMAPMLNDFRQVAASITYRPPTLPLIANITGTLAGADIATADYWVRHVSEAVRFADGLATLRGQGVTTFLEIGPKPTLLGLAQMEYEGRGPAHEKADKMDASHAARRSPRWLPSLRQNHSDWQQMLISLGTLYTQGAKIDWVALDQDWPRHKIELPTYPFQRQRYWPTASTRRQASAMLRPLIDRQVKLPAKRETLFETALSVAALPFLADHRIYGTVVVPGASHLALVLSAAEITFGGSSYVVSDLIFPQPLILAQEQETHTAQLLCQPQPVKAGERLLTFQLLSFVDSTTEDEPATTLHATGVVGPGNHTLQHEPTLAEHQALCTEALAVDFYTVPSESAAMHFGPTFQWLDGCWQPPTLTAGSPFQLLVRLRRPAVVDRLAGYIIHPGLLDGCFQAAGLAQQWATGSTELQLPFALTTASVTTIETGDVWWCHLEQSGAQWQIRLFDELGQLMVQLDGFQLRAVPPTAIQRTRLPTDWLHTLDWKAAPLTTATPLYHPDCWWVVGGTGALQSQLIEQLHRPERPVIVADPDITLQKQVPALAATRHSVGVIYLGNATATNGNVAEATHQLCTDLLHLTQALLASTLSVRLWIVTENCQMQDKRAPEHRMCAEATAGGALWGMGRTIAQEQPQWHPVCLDLDSSLAVEQQATLLQAELQGAPTNTAPMTEIAYQQQNRHVAHLVPWQTFDAALPQRLQLQAYGALEHLHFVPLQRRAPAAGEIEIAVKAAGLNFRDLLNALGLLQDYYATVLGVTQASAVSLGFECAGVVTAVGKGVSTLAVGDRVMGLTGFTSAFATHVTLPAAQMVAIPASFTEEEAATLPLAFLTAWYGLVELAQLQPGQRVRIHAASGGVGQAAVQIAHARGAEVFATASPGKWEFLHRQGVTHIFNSRTLHFTKELLHCTNGQGVDVVLNSLKGDFIAHTLATLGEGGRFIEIGKLGIWSTEQMAQARPDVVYHSFDLGEAMAQEPSLQARLWGAITEQLQTGALHPLPYTAFGAQEAVSAFRYMQQARQIGKVVLTFAVPELFTLQANATYLVTGGLGGLGVAIAQQLVADGARQLILTSRRGVTTAEQQQALDQLTAAGASVQVISADIGDRSAVQALLERCTAIAPLRGIVHAAGVLEDGMLASQTPARFATVLRPKVDGAWHLHTLTDGMNLEFFIAFSSIAALLGSPGQSNYAAANAFLDTLMQQRRQMGLAGLSINWGPWAEVGMAAHLHDRLQQQGMALISPQQGRLFFQYLLAQTKANLSGQVGILPSRLTPADTQTPPQRTTVRDLLAALPPSERKARLEHAVRSELAAVLRINSNTPLDAYTRLFDFGLDSLMAVELKNKLEMQLDCTLRATVIFDYPTLAVLLPYLYHDILGYTEAPALPLEKSAGGVQQNLEALSSQELDDLLEQELAFLEK
jgi:myxalamid-type polyketide synthase MxaB